MKYKLFVTGILLLHFLVPEARDRKPTRDTSSGTFSLGTRNTSGVFSDDHTFGLGIGGQFRLQINDRINTEWFADFITSKYSRYTLRNDYHIGWSVMYYPGKEVHFKKLFQPYLLIGHCFDISVIMEQANPLNRAERTSMATQAGIGTHLNITDRLDCSLSGQYMLHFGKEIVSRIETDAVLFETHNHSAPDGHLLLTVSFNYKFGDLW